MAKTKSAFVCNDCGADYRKWQGQCSACQAWNTLSEVRLSSPAVAKSKSRGGYAGSTAAVQTLSEIDLVDLPRNLIQVVHSQVVARFAEIAGVTASRNL